MTTITIKEILSEYNLNGYKFAYITDNDKKIVLTKQHPKEYQFMKIIIPIDSIQDNIEWMTKNNFTILNEN